MPIETPHWVRDAVFYQIFPDRFARSGRVPAPGPLEPWDAPPTGHGFKGGDLLGIADRLPYLADLGITALYLTPVFASASNHRYHTYDYMAVDPLLGGNDALRVLLDASHARGIRVVLDGVFNHTGRGFWAFHHVLENGEGSPYRDWFHFHPGALAGRRPFRPYPWPGDHDEWPVDPAAEPTWDEKGDESFRRLGYRAWWGLAALPKLNTSNPAVREHLMTVAEHWLRFGIDGWRLDVPTEIRDEAFWQEFRRRCRAINPEAYIVGEIWHEAQDWLAGDRFDAVMNYPLAHAILGYAAQDHLDPVVVHRQYEYGRGTVVRDGAAFGVELERLMALYDPAVTHVQLNLLDSHDSPRFRTLAGRDTAAWRLATLLLATLPGAPCIYYGDEVGVEGDHDPDCRRSFPWDEAGWDRDGLAWTQAVLRMRHAAPVLRRGGFRAAGASGGALAYVRAGGGGELAVVAVNAGDAPAELDLLVPEAAGTQARRCAAPRSGEHPRRGRRCGTPEDPGAGACRHRTAPGPSERASLPCRRAAQPRLRVSSGHVADLPFNLPDALAQRLRAAADTEGKIVRALDALGPLSGRDVALLDVPAGILRDGLLATGLRTHDLAAADPLRLDLPDASVDALVAMWGGFAGVRAAELAEADRVLRPGGRLLVVHDYGRDDVSALADAAGPQYREWSHRGGPFLRGGGFKIRVLHCFWTFESLDDARAFLGDAFGERGAALGASLKRPRLSWNVAVYHRWQGGVAPAGVAEDAVAATEVAPA